MTTEQILAVAVVILAANVAVLAHRLIALQGRVKGLEQGALVHAIAQEIAARNWDDIKLLGIANQALVECVRRLR